MTIVAGLLMIGLLCNLLIRPVADKWFMTTEELAEEKRHTREIIAEEEVHFINDKGQGSGAGKPTHAAMV